MSNSDWLAGPAPTGKLDRDALEERILNLFATQITCVLASIGPDGPLATPVRYYNRGLALMFTASPRSPKMRNLAADPRVSVGIVAPYVSEASSRGAQVFGTARILHAGDADFDVHWPSYRWESEHAERGLPLDLPKSGPLVVIEPRKIVYTEWWLRRSGHAPRQTWLAPPPPQSSS
jgi:hypothetical protein